MELLFNQCKHKASLSYITINCNLKVKKIEICGCDFDMYMRYVNYPYNIITTIMKSHTKSDYNESYDSFQYIFLKKHVHNIHIFIFLSRPFKTSFEKIGDAQSSARQ